MIFIHFYYYRNVGWLNVIAFLKNIVLIEIANFMLYSVYCEIVDHKLLRK